MSKNINSKICASPITFSPQETNILLSKNMGQHLNGPVSNFQSKVPSMINQDQENFANASKITKNSFDLKTNGLNPEQDNFIQSKILSNMGNNELIARNSKNCNIVCKEVNDML